MDIIEKNNLFTSEQVLTPLQINIKIREGYELLLMQTENLQKEIENLKAENQLMLPMIESFESLQRASGNMSITECAKHFGLHPKLQVFPFLRERGYLIKGDLPSQKAIDLKILIERQTDTKRAGYKGQAVVEKSSLEVWRVKVIPAIEKWSERIRS